MASSPPSSVIKHLLAHRCLSPPSTPHPACHLPPPPTLRAQCWCQSSGAALHTLPIRSSDLETCQGLCEEKGPWKLVTETRHLLESHWRLEIEDSRSPVTCLLELGAGRGTRLGRWGRAYARGPLPCPSMAALPAPPWASRVLRRTSGPLAAQRALCRPHTWTLLTHLPVSSPL